MPSDYVTKEEFNSFKTEVLSRFDGIDRRSVGTDKKFVSIDQRFDAIDKRFVSIDQRFDDVYKRFDIIDQRFDAIDKKFDDIADMFVKQREEINKDFERHVKSVTDIFTDRLQLIFEYMKHIERKLDDHIATCV